MTGKSERPQPRPAPSRSRLASEPRWRWTWLAWIAAGIVLEAIALRRPARGDTLSETWWWMQGVPAAGRLLRYGTLVFLGWLAVHFFTDGAV